MQLIKIAKEEESINSGKFFDLMYANYENPAFDSTKQYAFLRSGKREFIMVITNFSSQFQEIAVHIPEDAFNYMGINPQKIKNAKELFSKKNFQLNSRWDNVLYVNMEAYSGKIIKFSMD